MLAAIGARFDESGEPRGLTTLHPIAAGDMWGVKGIDHIAKPGLLARILGGSYPSGPSAAEPPVIWRMIGEDAIPAYNIPSGILFDMHREAAAKRPGVLTKVGLDTFVDPDREGCAMNRRAAAAPVVDKVEFAGDTWLFFPTIVPQVAIIRATTADERGNLSYEHEGGYLGPLDQALAVAQQRRRRDRAGEAPRQGRDAEAAGGVGAGHSGRPRRRRAGADADDADRLRPGDLRRGVQADGILLPRRMGSGKVIGRRVAQELKRGDAVNLGFGISANVPRILIEEGRHGEVTWVIEQGAVGGVPLLDFQFGCAANAEAIVPSPYQFTYFQGAGFDASLLSFLQIDREGCVNVSKLGVRPHVTAGAGGFVDITAQARKIVFSGFFSAGASLSIADGRLAIAREGKVMKLVETVEHVSFSGRRAIEQGQDITYVTERCVMRLGADGVEVTEVAPGADLKRDILDRAEFPLLVRDKPRTMDPALFSPEPFGLVLGGANG